MITSEFDKRINVCYCGNEKVFPLILLSVLSIVKYTPSPLTVYLMTMDLRDVDERFTPIQEDQREILDRVLQEKNPESRAVILRADEPYGRLLKGGRNENSVYTPYTLLRLLLNEFDLPDRVIYLDADTMCCSDVRQFSEIDLKEYEFAAVRDQMGQFWIRRNYFNAGVMYFNLKKIRETGLIERARKMLVNKKLYFSDQTVLNKFSKKVLLLPRRFNEQRAIREDTIIKHFCRGIKWLPFFKVYNYKQTEVNNVHNKLKIFQFDDLYAAYGELAKEYSLPTLK